MDCLISSKVYMIIICFHQSQKIFLDNLLAQILMRKISAVIFRSSMFINQNFLCCIPIIQTRKFSNPLAFQQAKRIKCHQNFQLDTKEEPSKTVQFRLPPVAPVQKDYWVENFTHFEWEENNKKTNNPKVKFLQKPALQNTLQSIRHLVVRTSPCSSSAPAPPHFITRQSTCPNVC